MALLLLLLLTSLGSYTDPEQISLNMDLLQRLFYTLLGYWDDQGHIMKVIGLPLWLCYTFLASCTDQEQYAVSHPSLQQYFHISLGQSVKMSQTNTYGQLILIILALLSMAWINISLSTAYHSQVVASKKMIIFYLFFTTFSQHWHIHKWINRLSAIIAGAWNILP